jgi:hypothetical protein
MKKNDVALCPNCKMEMEVGFKEDFNELFCEIIYAQNGRKDFVVCYCDECDIMEIPLLE